MSRSVDLFIDLDPPIESVVERIGRLIPFRLRPGEVPDRWSLDEGEVHAELHAHPYIDDGELMFGRYRWALSCRVGNGVRPADAPETALLRVVSEALQRGGIAALLVHDLQYRDDRASAVVPADGEPTTPLS